jgi:hypothetical protein
MVAFAKTSDSTLKTSPRARGQHRTCTSRPLPCFNSSTQANLRTATHKKRKRLGSCSKDPIGYVDGKQLYSSFFHLSKLDPSGRSWINPCGGLAPPGPHSGQEGDEIDGDGTDARLCRWVNCWLQMNAVGMNQTLLDHWLNGSGSDMYIDFDHFDSLGSNNRNDVIDEFSSKLAIAGAGLACGKSTSLKDGILKPGFTNRWNLWITPMIYGWQFWYDCNGTAKKNCGWCNNCMSLSTKGNCFFHAEDLVEFHPNSAFYLPIPGVHIADRLIRACNPKGKGFKLYAHDTKPFARLYTCNGQRQILH